MNGKCRAFQSLMNFARGSPEFTLEQQCEASADRQDLQMHFTHMITSSMKTSSMKTSFMKTSSMIMQKKKAVASVSSSPGFNVISS